MVVNMKLLIFINNLLLFEMTGISISRQNFRELVVLFEESMCCWGMYGKAVRECAALSDSSTLLGKEWQTTGKKWLRFVLCMCLADMILFLQNSREKGLLSTCNSWESFYRHCTALFKDSRSSNRIPHEFQDWLQDLFDAVFSVPETLPNSLAELLIVTMPSTNLQALDGYSSYFPMRDRTLIAQYFGPLKVEVQY